MTLQDVKLKLSQHINASLVGKGLILVWTGCALTPSFLVPISVLERFLFFTGMSVSTVNARDAFVRIEWKGIP